MFDSYVRRIKVMTPMLSVSFLGFHTWTNMSFGRRPSLFPSGYTVQYSRHMETFAGL